MSKIDEVNPWSKAMQQHASSDAYKADQQKKAKVGGLNPSQKEPSLTKKDPSEFDPSQFTPQPGAAKTNETDAGAAVGFQMPLGIKQRKKNIDELLAKHEDIGEGVALAFLASLDEEGTDRVCGSLDSGELDQVADEMRVHAVREIVKQRMKEVVRKKPGGGGWVLYAPNPGKKKGSTKRGEFPTKLGAKRAQLARYPPKDSYKLQRLRKEVDRLTKDPRGKAKIKKKKVKSEAITPTKPGTMQPADALQQKSGVGGMNASKPAGGLHSDVNGFMSGLKTLPKTGPERGKYVTTHLSHAPFVTALQKHPHGQQLMGQLNQFANSKQNAGPQSPMKTTVQGESKNEVNSVRKIDFMHRTILAKAVTKALFESIFREEKTESEWDEYISKLSKKSLAGDSKFQKLMGNISKKTDGILNSAFDSIRRAVGKNAKLKSFGVKRDTQSGETYLAFGASFDNVTVEPMYIHIIGGVPKIEVSGNAKAALTKVDPSSAKMFRAELVTVQEGILDEMDDLAKAIQSRDKYLGKLEGEVDAYVAALSPLEISLLKNLLVKKYRKLS